MLFHVPRTYYIIVKYNIFTEDLNWYKCIVGVFVMPCVEFPLLELDQIKKNFDSLFYLRQ